MAGPLTDLFAWVVIAAFVTTALVSVRSDEYARKLAALGWTLFAGFWLVLVPHFAFTQRSYIEGILCAVAVPACLYVAYLVYDRRPSLLVLTRAVAVMGLVYLPFQTIVPLQRASIEMVSVHGHWLIDALGYETSLRTCAAVQEAGYTGFDCLNPYKSVFLTTDGAGGGAYLTPVLLACTGIGSISIVAGLVLAVRGTARQKLAALAVSVPVIYGLNVIRVAFIVLAHAQQWFRGPLLNDAIMFMFGTEDAKLVSYYVADRVIAQSLSVVALIVIGFALVRIIPSLAVVLEELAYLLTGDDHNFEGQFG